LHPPWNEFLSRQVQQCKARQQARGLPQALLVDLDRYLEQTANVLPIDVPAVLLTGEFTPENLLMQQHADAWKISGLIDFGDSMAGFGEYDLLGPGTFMASGNPARLRALLAGFGYTDAPLNSRLSQRLMRLLLIHRHSDLTVQVQIDGWHTRVKNLDQLEQLLWPL
jgi:hygromycin-B 7''-O-kinase